MPPTADTFLSGLGLGGLTPVALAMVAVPLVRRRLPESPGVLTACGTFLLRDQLPLPPAYGIVFVTGIGCTGAIAGPALGGRRTE